MVEQLQKLLENSYSPYSHFKVASIVITKDGKAFSGVNIENSSFGGTICAERNAINSAVTSGYKKGDFKEIYIMCDEENFGMPCMICRQTFIEFFTNDITIYVYNNKGEVKSFTLNELCPYPFSEEDLKWKVDL